MGGKVRARRRSAPQSAARAGGVTFDDEVDRFIDARHATRGANLGRGDGGDSDNSAENELLGGVRPVMDLSSSENEGGSESEDESDAESEDVSEGDGDSGIESEIESELERVEAAAGGGWGAKKTSFYGADNEDYELMDETEQEEALKEEEEEATRLMQRRLAGLQPQDFGVDEAESDAGSGAGKETGALSKQSGEAVSITIPEDFKNAVQLVSRDVAKLSSEEKLRIVERESPELIRLFTDCDAKNAAMRKLEALLLAPVQIDREPGSRRPRHRSGSRRKPLGESSEKDLGALRVQYELYASYCRAILTYACLKAEADAPLGSHPIVEHLVEIAALVRKVDALPESAWDMSMGELSGAAKSTANVINASGNQAKSMADAEIHEHFSSKEEEDENDKSEDEKGLAIFGAETDEGNLFLKSVLGSQHCKDVRARGNAENVDNNAGQRAEGTDEKGRALNALVRSVEQDRRNDERRRKNVNAELEPIACAAEARKADNGTTQGLARHDITGNESNAESSSIGAGELESAANRVYNEAVEKTVARKRARAEREAERAQEKFEHEHPLYASAEDLKKNRIEGDQARRASKDIIANRGLTPRRRKQLKNPRVKHRVKFDKALSRSRGYRRVGGASSGASYGGESSGINLRSKASVRLG